VQVIFFDEGGDGSILAHDAFEILALLRRSVPLIFSGDAIGYAKARRKYGNSISFIMRLTLFALLICVVSQTAFAQPNDTTSHIDKIFSSWNNATPGGSVLVARGTNIIYHKAYGMADLERNVPNSTGTIFEAGSVSKQFTAFSILLLENEGKLSRADDVRKHIPELPVYEAPITIQHLLNHTSGLKDWGSVAGISGWGRDRRGHTLELALQIIFRQKSLNFKPGDQYSYSNSNYTMLVAIVERVSKQKLEVFTQERLFTPLGMTKTKWRSNYREIVPNRAQAYRQVDDKYEILMPIENIYGHAGLLTTTGDLLKWNQLLETHQIGGEEVLKRRIENGKLNDNSSIIYASGIENHVANSGYRVYAHSGATAGYKALLMYYPEKKLSVVILGNIADFEPVKAGFDVSDIYLGHGPEKAPAVTPTTPEKPAVFYDAKTLGSFTGDYFSEEAQCNLQFVVTDNTLHVIDMTLQDAPLNPTPTLDEFRSGPLLYQFKRNNKGAVTGFHISVSRASNVPFKKISK
jgi:CubicO group peptidase (beta-lactamase class C family)